MHVHVESKLPRVACVCVCVRGRGIIRPYKEKDGVEWEGIVDEQTYYPIRRWKREWEEELRHN